MVERFIKYGFTMDENKCEFNKMFGNRKLKEVYIDMNMYDPYMLCSRVVENNVMSVIENGRVIIKKRNEWKTTIMNVPLDCIDMCMVREYDGSKYEFAFKVYDVWYTLLAVL